MYNRYIYPDYQGRYDHVEGLINDSDVGDIIKLHHEVTGEVKEKLLLDSDIFIQTSRFEGMPLGIIEALSYGIPCLITEEQHWENILVLMTQVGFQKQM